MIYGKKGQLSQCLVVNALKYGFRPIIIGRPETSIDDFEAISKRIKEYRPDIFINASAYNDVEGAETNYDTAYEVNATGPMLMSRAAKASGIPIIHVSTDYVFSGEKNTPYKEEDKTNPINKYGQSKLLGEEKVKEENNNHVIIRTSWVFSPYASNFLKTIINKSAQTKDALKMADDQFNIPTSGLELAKIILQISRKIIANKGDLALLGTFHVTSSGVINRLEYAEYIMEKAKQSGLPYSEIIPVKASSFNSKATRPLYSALDTSKVINSFDVEIVDWRKAIEDVINIIAAKKQKI